MAVQLGPVVMDGLESFVQFGFGEITFAVEIEVAVFTDVQLGQFLLNRASELQRGGLPAFDRIIHQGSGPCAEVLRQSDGDIVGSYSFLYFGHGEIREVASQVGLAPPAHVVKVQLPALALPPHDDEPSFAAVAPDHAFEVVVVGAFPVTAPAFGQQDPLHPVEQFLIDERFVLARIFDTVPLDVAEVVSVLQHSAEPVDRNRTFAVATVRAGTQPGFGQLFLERFVAVAAGGVQLIGQPDERCPLLVDDDAGHQPALDAFLDVQVAERRAVDGAALLAL